MSDSHNASFGSSSTEPLNSRRKRGRVACDSCHSRKVRCDFTSSDMPCTNCRLDKQKCFAWKPRRKHQNRLAGKAPTPGTNQVTTVTETVPQSPLDVYLQHVFDFSVPSHIDFPLPTSPPPHGASVLLGDEGSIRGLFHQDPPSERIIECPAHRGNVSSGGSSPPLPVPSMLGETASESSQRISDQSVVFSYYDFLELQALPKLLSADVKYLESKGCFRVPSDSYLDDFMQVYFLHVHPCMPILNEGEFWNLYGQKDNILGASKVSLLVLQAMLFAASALVPLRTLRACGFRDSHEARERLHQRATLLCQFQSESNLASRAQASLLLSFQSSVRDVHNNTSFLSTAIQCARAERAHLYSVLPQISARERQDKKRLWWCCLVRDRVIALGMRRPLQITPDQFDHRREPFTEEDLVSEIGRSRVYDSETKRSLIKIFVTQCELAVALTSTIMAIYPLDSVPMSLSHASPELVGLSDRMKSCRQDLNRWFGTAEARLKHISGKDVQRDDFVTLYADLLRIYYFSAQMALGHFIIYTFSRSHTVNPDWMMQLNASKSDLKTAFTGLKGIFKRLVISNLAGHLPISASAYTALPLLLISLDVRLSPSDYQKKSRMRDLSHCTEAMRQYESRFSFAKLVSDIVRRVLQLVDYTSWSRSARSPPADSLSGLTMSIPNHRPQTWSEICLQNPELYFKLLFSLDYSLSYGKTPSLGETPDWSPRRWFPQLNRSLEGTPEGELASSATLRSFFPGVPERSVPFDRPPNEQRETVRSIPRLSLPPYYQQSQPPEHEHVVAESQTNLAPMVSESQAYYNDNEVDAGDTQATFEIGRAHV